MLWPLAAVAVTVNAVGLFSTGVVGDVTRALTLGPATTDTVTLCCVVATVPLESRTVRVTVYVPAVVNVWV